MGRDGDDETLRGEDEGCQRCGGWRDTEARQGEGQRGEDGE